MVYSNVSCKWFMQLDHEVGHPRSPPRIVTDIQIYACRLLARFNNVSTGTFKDLGWSNIQNLLFYCNVIQDLHYDRQDHPVWKNTVNVNHLKRIVQPRMTSLWSVARLTGACAVDAVSRQRMIR